MTLGTDCVRIPGPSPPVTGQLPSSRTGDRYQIFAGISRRTTAARCVRYPLNIVVAGVLLQDIKVCYYNLLRPSSSSDIGCLQEESAVPSSVISA